jgi:osmotically inducible lipoprotein OsmB
MREPDLIQKTSGTTQLSIRKKWRKHLTKIAAISITAIALTAMTGCSNMSTRDKNTAIGATVGAAAPSSPAAAASVPAAAGRRDRSPDRPLIPSAVNADAATASSGRS